MKTARSLTLPFSLLCLIVILAGLISGCASSPGTKSVPGPEAAEASGLSAADLKQYEAALIHLDAGEAEKAERALLSLVQRHAAHSGIWMNLATAHYRNGNLEQAEKALAHAEEIDTSIPDIHNLLGLIATERGHYPAAEQHFLAAIENDAEHANSHYNLALLYDLFHQDLARALGHYERYLLLTDSEDDATVAWVNQIKQSLGQEAER